MLSHFGISTWDVLMVGDGSGSGWDIGMGWSGVLCDRVSNCRKQLWGGWNTGAITIAELMPYVHGLAWFEANFGEDRRQLKVKHRMRPVLEIHVISDNETIVRQGNGMCGRNKMTPWWQCWDALMRNGYTAKFHFAGRLEVGINILCDRVAGRVRECMQAMTLDVLLPNEKDLSIYSINSSD